MKLYSQVTFQQKWQAACFFQKTKTWPKLLLWRKKIIKLVFFWQVFFFFLQLWDFTRENDSFTIRHQIPSSQKHVSMQFQSCIKTFRTHWTIPYEKQSGESVFWVLSSIPVISLIRWYWTVRWLPSKSGKQPISFRKQKLGQRKEYVCAFLAGLRPWLSNFHRQKICFLP